MPKMNQPNRTLAPTTLPINKLDFPICKQQIGQTRVPLYFLPSTVEEVLRIEFVFDAGIAQQSQKSIASATNSLISEGTLKRNAQQVADELDFFGSYFQARCAVDDAQLTLYCLKKHLTKCLEVIEDVIVNPLFPDNEIDIYIKNNKQRLKVQQEKTSYRCRRAFYERIFGTQSPISSFSQSDDYDKISRETLLDFHRTNYQKSIKYITISGDTDESVVNALNAFSSNFTPQSSLLKYRSGNITGENQIYLKKEKSSQATLRLGRKLFNRTHQDFRKLQLCNLVLGGYFGSRLMKNIREDKGLTYGIHSVLESYLDDGCFYIEADVNSSKVNLAVTEVKNELTILCNEKINGKELETAKNYLLGSILRGMDGPFTLMDRNRILIDYGFQENYYDELLHTINTITAEEMRELYQAYFTPSSLVEVVCGG